MPQTLTARRRSVWFEVMQGPAMDCQNCNPEWATVCPSCADDCPFSAEDELDDPEADANNAAYNDYRLAHRDDADDAAYVREIEDRRYAAQNGTP